MDDVVLNKAEIIERCIARIHEVYQNSDASLADMTKLDSIILNIQRACEAAIDLGAHYVSQLKLGAPKTTREIFVLLTEANLISAELSKRLQSMVGFRNIAVHDYTKINIEIISAIIKSNLDDLREFTKIVLRTN